MYHHIMVPLDGSPLAEQALPHALALARAFDAALELVAVVPPGVVEGGPEYAVYLDRDSEVHEDEAYLQAMQSQVAADGLQAHIRVRRGDVAAELLHHAEEARADLIVMSTHGRSGLGRWVYGSIADRVLRHAPVPVLLVRATE